MTISTDSPDDSIRAAAIAKGFVDAAVVTQKVKDRPGVLDVGDWFVLSVKRQVGDDWEMVGRRRTYGELLQLLRA